MTTRDITKSDIPVIEGWLREKGFDYELPDLFSDEIVHTQLQLDENGNPVNVIFGVKTVEMYFLNDSSWGTPRERLFALQESHEVFRKWLYNNRWLNAFAVLPPKVAKSFGKRLQSVFSWSHGTWEHYSRRTDGDK